MKSRVSWIDVFKGISILLVILQHCCGVSESGKFILSFHMALFFWISGYHSGNRQSCRGGVFRKGLDFLKYQIWIGITNIIWYYVINELILHHDMEQRWADYFLTWFLPTMLWVTVLHAYLEALYTDRARIIAGILIALALGYILTRLDLSWDIVHISKLPIAYTFYLTGMLCHDMGFENLLEKIKRKWMVLLLLFAVTVVSERFNTPVYWYSYELGNYIFFIISSLGGIGMITYAAVLTDHSSVLEFFGKYSIIIYSIQFLLYRIIMMLVTHFVTHGMPASLAGFIFTSAACYGVTKCILRLGMIRYK